MLRRLGRCAHARGAPTAAGVRSSTAERAVIRLRRWSPTPFGGTAATVHSGVQRLRRPTICGSNHARCAAQHQHGLRVPAPRKYVQVLRHRHHPRQRRNSPPSSIVADNRCRPSAHRASAPPALSARSNQSCARCSRRGRSGTGSSLRCCVLRQRDVQAYGPPAQRVRVGNTLAKEPQGSRLGLCGLVQSSSFTPDLTRGHRRRR